jgi:hypothetical protein
MMVTLMALGRPALAQGDDPRTKLVKVVEPWAVIIAPHGGCGLYLRNAAGASLTIGYNDKRLLSIQVAHEQWKSLTPGYTYEMAFLMGQIRYGVSMRAERESGGSIVVKDSIDGATQAQAFLQELKGGSQLKLFYETREVTIFELRQIGPAVDELVRCQATQNKGKPPPPAGPPKPTEPPTDALPKLSPQQRLDTMRLAVNLLNKLPGFRMLNAEEQKALDPRIAAFDAAVVWRTEKVVGMIHLFVEASADNVHELASYISGVMVQTCGGKFEVVMQPDVRSDIVKRMRTLCTDPVEAEDLRIILMPSKGGVYYLAVVGPVADSEAITRAEELLRNALFEVVPK